MDPNRRGIATMTMLFTLFALAECSGREPPADSGSAGFPVPATAPAPLVLTLEAPPRAAPRDLVPLRMILENRGERSVEVGLGGSPIAFDFVITTAEGRQVWSRLEGVPVEAILQPRTLMPGESITFTDSWHQRDDRGRRVQPGTFRVRGVLPVVDVPEGWGTEPLTLEIGN
jgi:hypothetical protein